MVNPFSDPNVVAACVAELNRLSVLTSMLDEQDPGEGSDEFVVRRLFEVAVGALDHDAVIEQICRAQFPHHWPRVPNPAGERMRAQNVLDSLLPDVNTALKGSERDSSHDERKR